MKRKYTNNDPHVDVRSVLFVDHTPDIKLARLLSDEEDKISQVTGYLAKIVEKAGDRLDRTHVD